MIIIKPNSYIKIQLVFLKLFTFTSFNWIYDSFYRTANGKTIKIVPNYIADYLTPLGLAHWIMQDGSYQKGQGVYLATNSFTYEECQFLANILTKKYKLKSIRSISWTVTGYCINRDDLECVLLRKDVFA